MQTSDAHFFPRSPSTKLDSSSTLATVSLLVSGSDWNHHLRADGEVGTCGTVEVCIKRRVSREERVGCTGVAREREGECVRVTGEGCLRLDIRGGGRKRGWGRDGEEGSLARGGGVGNILSERASCSAFIMRRDDPRIDDALLSQGKLWLCATS